MKTIHLKNVRPETLDYYGVIVKLAKQLRSDRRLRVRVEKLIAKYER